MNANNPSQRSFNCLACQKEIKIPYNLPPTVAPCPHCGEQIQSPAPPVKGTASTEQASSQTQATPATNPPAELADAPSDDSSVISTPASASKKAFPLGILLVAIIGLALLIPAAIFLKNKFKKRSARNAAIEQHEINRQKAIEAGIPGAELTQEERQYLREGWRNDTQSVLKKFLHAKTSTEKAKYIIDGENRISELEAFYENSERIEGDTPFDAFTHANLPYEDMKRGIFHMSYSRPPNYELSNLFTPVIPLGVRFGIDPPSLLYTTVDKTEFFSKPQKINAFFKKENDQLRLCWDTFVQSKYKLLGKFVGTPQQNKKEKFRLVIHQGIMPPHGFETNPNENIYILNDGIPDGNTRVIVDKDSPLGKQLSSLNWVGEKEFTARTATVELEWLMRDGKPIVGISKLICWEYLNIGGDPSNLEESSPAQEAP